MKELLHRRSLGRFVGFAVFVLGGDAFCEEMARQMAQDCGGGKVGHYPPVGHLVDLDVIQQNAMRRVARGPGALQVNYGGTNLCKLSTEAYPVKSLNALGESLGSLTIAVTFSSKLSFLNVTMKMWDVRQRKGFVYSECCWRLFWTEQKIRGILANAMRNALAA